MKIKSILTLAFTLLLGYAANAHSRTEIGYHIIEKGQQTHVEVHLTSSTLFDLLYELHPKLKVRESLNLSHYVADYEAYFNDKLGLRLNGQDRSLKYVDSNLIIHDAIITFVVEEFNQSIRNYRVTTGGFEFYQRPNFTVILSTEQFTDTHFLTKNENTCAGGNNIPLIGEVNPQSISLFAIGLAVLFFLGTAYLIYYKRSPVVN